MTVNSLLALKAASLMVGMAGAGIIALEPTEKVALIVGVTAIFTALIGSGTAIFLDSRSGKRQEAGFKVLHDQATKIEISVDGNTTKMLNRLDRQEAELKDATARYNRAEARTEGDQDRESKAKEKT
jgi:hypothetical protein